MAYVKCFVVKTDSEEKLERASENEYQSTDVLVGSSRHKKQPLRKGSHLKEQMILQKLKVVELEKQKLKKGMWQIMTAKG